MVVSPTDALVVTVSGMAVAVPLPAIDRATAPGFAVNPNVGLVTPVPASLVMTRKPPPGLTMQSNGLLLPPLPADGYEQTLTRTSVPGMTDLKDPGLDGAVVGGVAADRRERVGIGDEVAVGERAELARIGLALTRVAHRRRVGAAVVLGVTAAEQVHRVGAVEGHDGDRVRIGTRVFPSGRTSRS